MAYSDRIKSALRELRNGDEKPRTRTINVTQSDKIHYFDHELGRKREDVLRNQKIYNSGGIVTQIINLYPEYMWMNAVDNEIELQGDNSAAVDACYEIIDKFNFLDASWQQTVNSLVTGDGMAEIRYNRVGKFHDALPRDPYHFVADYDRNGDFVRWIQKSGTNQDKGIPIEADKLWHVKLFPMTDSIHGYSLVGTAVDEIMRDAKTGEGIARGIERHGTPKWDISIATEDREVSDSDVKATGEEFANINSDNEIVHRDDVTINELDKAGIPVAEYSETSIQRLCGALGVPFELFMKGASSLATTDTSPQMKVFERKIKTIQARFNYQTYHQLFKPILEEEYGIVNEKVRIKFGDVIPTDFEARAKAIKELMPQVDPFAIFHRDEIRAAMGYVPYEKSDLKTDISEGEEPDEQDEPDEE